MLSSVKKQWSDAFVLLSLSFRNKDNNRFRKQENNRPDNQTAQENILSIFYVKRFAIDPTSFQ